MCFARHCGPLCGTGHAASCTRVNCTNSGCFAMVTETAASVQDGVSGPPQKANSQFQRIPGQMLLNQRVPCLRRFWAACLRQARSCLPERLLAVAGNGTERHAWLPSVMFAPMLAHHPATWAQALRPDPCACAQRLHPCQTRGRKGILCRVTFLSVCLRAHVPASVQTIGIHILLVQGDASELEPPTVYIDTS